FSAEVDRKARCSVEKKPCGKEHDVQNRVATESNREERNERHQHNQETKQTGIQTPPDDIHQQKVAVVRRRVELQVGEDAEHGDCGCDHHGHRDHCASKGTQSFIPLQSQGINFKDGKNVSEGYDRLCPEPDIKESYVVPLSEAKSNVTAGEKN